MASRAFIFDLDGTVYRGGAAIPGASRFLNRLIRDGVPFVFVTNRANRTSAEVADQLIKLGIPCTEHMVLTSAQATAAYLGGVKAYLIGGKGVEQALASVVVGDFLMTDILAAHNAQMSSVLILTGVSKREDIASAPCSPTWIVEDYSELETVVYPGPNGR